MKRRIATGGCCPTRKTRFRDECSARRAMQHAQCQGARMGKLITRYYWCHLCKGWHLTSQVSQEE